MKREPSQKPPPEKREAEREALIDEILEGTFPASDPPNWDGIDEDVQTDEEPAE
jgi:hypothetical protein